MKEIVIVTAFFDIGRGNYDKLRRDNDKYFENFEFWARIKNRLIAFCGSNEHKKKILKIRESFGKLSETDVIVIEDITKCVPGLYEQMEAVSSDKYFKNIRVMKNTLSDKPMYDLVNYLKLYFINQASHMINHDTQFAWMDFGFNHGGSAYPDPKEFDFNWEFNCHEKVHFFYEKELDVRPMFEVIRTVKPDPMLGAMFLVPSCHAETLWNTFVGGCIQCWI